MVYVYERALPGDSGMTLASITTGLNLRSFTCSLCDLAQATQPVEEQ